MLQVVCVDEMDVVLPLESTPLPAPTLTGPFFEVGAGRGAEV